MKSQVALAAKAIKAELKAAFPGITFSVTSETYTGGNSVNISYEDSVCVSVIENVVGKYQMGSFNGLEDIYEYDNRNKEIPQAKYVFVRRTCSFAAKIEIAKELGIPENEIGSFNHSKNEWNEALIWQRFCTKTYGSHIEAMGASDDEPTAVLITEGAEVDLVTELFDNTNAREVEVPETLGVAFKSPVLSASPLYGFERLVHHFHASGLYASLRGESQPIAVAEYPNEVCFDKVYKDYPGGQILRVTEAFGGPGDWFPISNFFKENEIEFWTPAEMIQRLIDRDGATKFTLEIEDEYGRIKNPDYSKNDLVPNREN